MNIYFGWGDPETDYDAKMLGQADRAIALDPEQCRGRISQRADYLSLGSRRYNEALGVTDAGLAIDPNYVGALLAANRTPKILSAASSRRRSTCNGRCAKPARPLIGSCQVELGDAEISLGHFDAAIDEYRKAIDSGTRTFFAYTNLAAAYAHAGKMDEAKAALAEARRLNPQLTVKWMIEHTPNLPAVIRRPAQGGAAGGMKQV